MSEWKRIGRATKRTAVACLLAAGFVTVLLGLADLLRDQPNYSIALLIVVVLAVIFWLSYTYEGGKDD